MKRMIPALLLTFPLFASDASNAPRRPGQKKRPPPALDMDKVRQAVARLAPPEVPMPGRGGFHLIVRSARKDPADAGRRRYIFQLGDRSASSFGRAEFFHDD